MIICPRAVFGGCCCRGRLSVPKGNARRIRCGVVPGGYWLQLLVFEREGFSWEVADFGGSEVLDGAWIAEFDSLRPCVAVFREGLEGGALQVDESLADDGDVLSVAVFHVHHHRERDAAGDPLVDGLGDVSAGGHVSRLSGGDQCACGESEGVAVVCVEVGGGGATSLVSEEVALAGELDLLSGGVEDLDVRVDHLSEHLLGFNLRDLDIAVGVAVADQLRLDGGGKGLEDLLVGVGKILFDECDLAVKIKRVKLRLVLCKQVVEFGDEGLDLGDELNEPLGNEDDAEVHGVGGAVDDDCGQLVHDLLEGELLCGDLLRDDARLRVCLECAFQCDVGCGAPHQLDEVPVFACAICVAHDVSDQFRVDLGCGVEAEGDFDPCVLEVSVDSLRASDHLDSGVLGEEILRQGAGIRIRVVPADDDNCGDAMLLAGRHDLLKLLLGLELCAPAADHVKATRIAVAVDDFVRQEDLLVLDESRRASEESEELVFGVKLLESVVESRDHIVSAGGLSSGEDDASLDRGGFALFAGDEIDCGQSVCVGEEPLDGVLVCDRLGGLAGSGGCEGAVFNEDFRETGLICGTGLLQGGDLHDRRVFGVG